MDDFISGNDESTLEVVTLVVVKARNPFLPIKKKIDPTLNLKMGRQTASVLAIVEVEAPPSQSKISCPPKRGREKVLYR